MHTLQNGNKITLCGDNDYYALVPCECGGSIDAHKQRLRYQSEPNRQGPIEVVIDCRNCYLSQSGRTEEAAVQRWNERMDWRIHEFAAAFTEEEYRKLVEAAGGKIKETKKIPYYPPPTGTKKLRVFLNRVVRKVSALRSKEQ